MVFLLICAIYQTKTYFYRKVILAWKQVVFDKTRTTMKSYNLLFELIFYSFHLGLFAEESLSIKCPEDYVFQFEGVISSPNYPSPLNNVYCHVWKIPVPPGTHLQIHLFDLDITEDLNCKPGVSCCGRNRLTLSPNSNDSLHFCGRSGQFPHSITISQSPAKIMYVYTNPVSSDRGFSLNYMTVILRDFTNNCADNKFECKNGTCIPGEMRCDFNIDCLDGEDEQNCPSYGNCPKGEISCQSSPKYCYKPEHRCDGTFQCIFGDDEVGCVPDCGERLITCSSGDGCYPPLHRCDSRQDCLDESDENGCPAELCRHLLDRRLCRNKRCLAARLWCDGSDDCGDGSDEENCLQNSVITAAMMGALVGGLFLVLAVGYTMRYYGRRPPSLRSQLASQLRLRHSVSLPSHMGYDVGLLGHREPPPAYSVAILPPPPATALPPGTAPRGHRPLLSGRRQPKATHHRRSRETAATAPVHTEAVPPTNQLLLTESADNQLLLTESANNQLLTESADNQLLTGTTPPATNYCSDDTVQLIDA